MKEQFIRVDICGSKHYYKDRRMIIRHREDGPAIEWEDGAKFWYIDGKYHREDGPAVEYPDGEKLWYINGILHREDGPAAEYAIGYKDWYINGELLTKQQFNARMNPVRTYSRIDCREVWSER